MPSVEMVKEVVAGTCTWELPREDHYKLVAMGVVVTLMVLGAKALEATHTRLWYIEAW
jgi:hypothetical protein